MPGSSKLPACVAVLAAVCLMDGATNSQALPPQDIEPGKIILHELPPLDPLPAAPRPR